MQLLLSLAGIREDQINPDDPKQLQDAVMSVFTKLDVDGDGTISWWEWKAVLAGTLNGRHPESQFVDPLDPLSIGILAAYDAMNARPPGITDTIAISEVSFLPLSGKGNAPPEGPTGFGYDPLIETLPPAKAVPLLQTVVKSLKGTNNTLTQRLEKALFISQQVSDGAPASSFFNPPPPGSTAGRSEVERTRIKQAEQKLLQIQKQTESDLAAFAAEKKRSSQLEAEISRLKGVLQVREKSATDIEYELKLREPDKEFSGKRHRLRAFKK